MWEKARDIRGRDFNDFLSGANIDQQCPQCQSINLFIPTEQGFADSPVRSVEFHTAADAPDWSPLAVPYTCRECGYIRFFMVDFVLDWLNKSADNG